MLPVSAAASRKIENTVWVEPRPILLRWCGMKSGMFDQYNRQKNSDAVEAFN